MAGSLIALVQRDIKKVLAYSTISQLGFMFAALGVGAWDAAFFHLMTHAAFKGLLFLTSGSVIHGAGTQDLWEMGGLRRQMPITFAVGESACLRWQAFRLRGLLQQGRDTRGRLHEAPIAGWALLAASALTAFYMARSTRLAFGGRPVRKRHIRMRARRR